MELEIIDLGMNGEGVAKLDGKIVLVPKALPHEIVEVDIIVDHGNYAEAKIKKVIKSSQLRRIPPCQATECGGCELLHMDYGMQLLFKQDLIKKTIKKITNIDVEVKPCVASDKEFNFRNKVSFSSRGNNFGMNKLQSHDVIDIDKCLLATDAQNKILQLFKKYCKYNNLIGYNGEIGVIKNLVIKDFSSGMLVAVVTTEKIDLSEFYEMLSRDFDNIGLYQIVNKRRDSVVLSGQIIHVGGLTKIELKEFGLKYPIDIIAFHQTNNYIQDKIYLKMLEYINENDYVINGFSGAGVLSAIIATKAKQVIGIELEKASHRSAEILKKNNSIKKLTNICGDFTKEYSKLVAKLPKHTLILDPSKKGCDKKILDKINADSVIYLSCNPIALAKDLRELYKNYIIEEIIPFDMFPNTTSVETLVKLRRR